MKGDSNLGKPVISETVLIYFSKLNNEVSLFKRFHLLKTYQSREDVHSRVFIIKIVRKHFFLNTIVNI